MAWGAAEPARHPNRVCASFWGLGNPSLGGGVEDLAIQAGMG